MWQTLDIVLKDFSEDGEECFLEAADCGGVGLAGDPDRQAQGLKQVVVKMRLAGILKMSDQDELTHVSPEQTRILVNPSVPINSDKVCITLLTKRSLWVSCPIRVGM